METVGWLCPICYKINYRILVDYLNAREVWIEEGEKKSKHFKRENVWLYFKDCDHNTTGYDPQEVEILRDGKYFYCAYFLSELDEEGREKILKQIREVVKDGGESQEKGNFED